MQELIHKYTNRPSLPRFFLEVVHGILSVQDYEQCYAAMPLDFNHRNREWPRRRIHKNHAVCKAIGLHKLKLGHTLSILDATAGLAHDAFIFAKLGADVTMLERHSLLASWIDTALQQLEDVPLQQRLRLLRIDARDYLSSTPNRYEVIYLDPMFGTRDKRAQAKKPMQILHALMGENMDADALLPLALQKATQRVVVKRHKLSPFLGQQSPTYQILGSSTRYDIYLSDAPQRCHT